MTSDTLLLNSTYEPLRIIGWQRAVTMMCLEKVDVIVSYESMLRSMSLSLQKPSVVRLCRYVRRHKMKVSLSRRNIHIRDKGKCQYCQKQLDLKDFTLDHVTPKSRGGQTSWTNIVAACGACNRKKGSKSLKEARMRLLAKPIEPRPSAQYLLSFNDNMPTPWQPFLRSLG